MKRNPWHAILLAFLVMNTAGTALLSLRYYLGVRKLQQLQAQVNFEMNVFRAIITDTVEYSKKNPAILPVLQSAGIAITSSQAAAPSSGHTSTK
jgi:hypothetical protein